MECKNCRVEVKLRVAGKHAKPRNLSLPPESLVLGRSRARNGKWVVVSTAVETVALPRPRTRAHSEGSGFIDTDMNGCKFARSLRSMEYKDTLNLPRTDFPMKADLVTREPERLKKWEAGDLYGTGSKEASGGREIRSACRAAFCQWRCAHRHGVEQDSQGHHRQTEAVARL